MNILIIVTNDIFKFTFFHKDFNKNYLNGFLGKNINLQTNLFFKINSINVFNYIYDQNSFKLNINNKNI